jgi:hypothetical protein
VKRRPGMPDPILARGDGPTLAMSTVHLDAARLGELLLFETTLRNLAPEGCTSEQTAQAHAAALSASGLAASDVEAPLALLRRFAANRALSERCAERLRTLLRTATDAKDAEPEAGELQERIGSLATALEAREDAATLAVLEAHRKEILTLFALAVP